MSSAVMLSKAVATPQTRLQVLDPFIAAVQRTLDDPARKQCHGAPVCLRVSGRELTVDPWTNEKLDPRLPTDDPLLSGCCRVVTQSVALLAKCAKDLANLEEQNESPTGDLYSARAELMLDAAIGSSLVRDVQHVIDDLLRQGHREEAGHLSKFHHQLRHTVYDLRKQVSPENRSTVDTLARQLSDCPQEPEERAREAAPAAASTPATAERPAPVRRRPLPGAPSPTATRRPRPPARPKAEGARANRAPRPRLPLRTAALALLLILTSLTLLSARRPDLATGGGGVEAAVAGPSFQGLVPLIEDRWPGLYVTVEEAAWMRLDEALRLQFVRELTGPLAKEHYSGLFVRSPEGRPLAQWLKTTGATLLDHRAEERKRM